MRPVSVNNRPENPGVAGAAGDLADPGPVAAAGSSRRRAPAPTYARGPDAISRRERSCSDKLGATDSGGCVPTTTERVPLLSGRDRITIAVTVVAAVLAGVLHSPMRTRCWHSSSPLSRWQRSPLVGRSVEALGDRLGPAGTGILQTALGNLPEPFVILFAQGRTVRRGEGDHRRLRSWPTSCWCWTGVRGGRSPNTAGSALPPTTAAPSG